MTTKIEWTDETWNPVTGCTRVSKGCDNCYAVRQTKRLAAIDHTREKYSGLVNEGKDHFNGVVKIHEDELDRPKYWEKPRKIFVCSMSDLFHPEVPFEFIDRVTDVMAECHKHTFQVLTKRPGRALDYFKWVGQKIKDKGLDSIPSQSSNLLDYVEGLPNVLLGVSVENQETADERIPYLLKCPARVRFLSCEPLLEEVDLSKWFIYHDIYEDGRYDPDPSIKWVIVGGESGPNARPMHPDWVRYIRDQCIDYEIPFFFKQWGAWIPSCIDDISGEALWENGGRPSDWPRDLDDPIIQVLDSSTHVHRIGKRKAGRTLDGVTWNEFPEQKPASHAH